MIGKYTAKVDDKGRLFVPAKLRAELGEEFYVTIGYNSGFKCLQVFTKEGWEAFCAKFNTLSQAQRSGATTLLFTNAVECNPDKQFRFTLTQNLFKYAGIDRDVVIAGVAGQALIWDAATYESFEQQLLTPENLFASLEALQI